MNDTSPESLKNSMFFMYDIGQFIDALLVDNGIDKLQLELPIGMKNVIHFYTQLKTENPLKSDNLQVFSNNYTTTAGSDDKIEFIKNNVQLSKSNIKTKENGETTLINPFEPYMIKVKNTEGEGEGETVYNDNLITPYEGQSLPPSLHTIAQIAEDGHIFKQGGGKTRKGGRKHKRKQRKSAKRKSSRKRKTK